MKAGPRPLITAIAAVLAASALLVLFRIALPDLRAPLLFLTLSVAVVSQYEGLRAGLVATALGTVSALVWMLYPAGTLTGRDLWFIVVFVPVNVLLSVFGGHRQRLLTDLRNANEKLEASQRRSRLKHEIARMGTFEWFVEQDRVEWSPEMEAVYGVDSETHQHTFNDWEARVHPEDLPATLAAMEEAVRRRQASLDTTYRIIRADGELRWIHSRGKYEYDAGGRPTHMIGVNVDITDLKQAEADLRRINAQLEAVLDSIPEPIMVTDVAGNLLRVNAAFQKDILYQTTVEGYVGHVEAYTETGDLIAVEDWPINRIRRGETVKRSDLILSVEGVRTRRRFSGSPVLDAQGDVTHAVVTFFDVSDEKRMADELRRSNEDLEAFAYTVSHDLAEPLRQVSAFSDLLTRRASGVLDAESVQMLQFIIAGTDRLSGMVDSLLHYSRVGSSEEPKQRVDCDEVLRRVCSNLELQIEHNAALVDVAELPEVWAWPNRLDQVFQNLIQNAIKYRKPETSPEIRVSARQSGSEWVFAVSDNGIGFEQSQAHRIFTVFQQLHPRGRYSGMGMGLAIVKRIVERHGGRVCAESTPGAGSTFYFTLPAS